MVRALLLKILRMTCPARARTLAIWHCRHALSESGAKDAAVTSALVNEAYQALKNPLSRGLYLLEVMGNPIDESSQISDMEFLGFVMEVRHATRGPCSLARPEDRVPSHAQRTVFPRTPRGPCSLARPEDRVPSHAHIGVSLAPILVHLAQRCRTALVGYRGLLAGPLYC
jgi:hypothetical protein